MRCVEPTMRSFPEGMDESASLLGAVNRGSVAD